MCAELGIELNFITAQLWSAYCERKQRPVLGSGVQSQTTRLILACSHTSKAVGHLIKSISVRS